ncbi:helix-turn-helix transcriptional regulator [Streptomyces sp. DSM 44915]|uniref:Helix-turn-helix transcriptional regulator n=1 Tax=Streptomyces chisholmiae TaxID=3075540 RepID=A0ABU2K056_9ACTN|nr:helix-turn-helix transcriptional regulator [Streptomyces sp. DSM 44915]MDT0270614.1 helix-turn-helix transcriptional regulator [Streptomyces sp. DSM 44915]
MTTTTRPAPPHGTRACYLRGCRRPPCRNANYRYNKWYSARTISGRIRTSAGPASSHVQALCAAGWSHGQIAAAAGTARSTIGRLAADAVAGIAPTIASAILAVPLGPPPPARDIEDSGTRRRLQALVAIGYSLTRIADAAGLSRTALGHIANGDVAGVRPTTARAVAEVYRRWSGADGGSAWCRTYAAKQGWHGPAAWDDIDDPDAVPEADDTPPTRHRDRLAAERRAEIQHLARFGVPEGEIAARLGMRPAYVHDIIRALKEAA